MFWNSESNTSSAWIIEMEYSTKKNSPTSQKTAFLKWNLSFILYNNHAFETNYVLWLDGNSAEDFFPLKQKGKTIIAHKLFYEITRFLHFCFISLFLETVHIKHFHSSLILFRFCSRIRWSPVLNRIRITLEDSNSHQPSAAIWSGIPSRVPAKKKTLML